MSKRKTSTKRAQRDPIAIAYTNAPEPVRIVMGRPTYTDAARRYVAERRAADRKRGKLPPVPELRALCDAAETLNLAKWRAIDRRNEEQEGSENWLYYQSEADRLESVAEYLDALIKLAPVRR